jgi:hypothetical protein
MLKSELSQSKLFSDSEEFFVIFSSICFVIPAFYFLINNSLLLSILFFLVAIFSVLHHTFPKKQSFRILDWISAIILILIYLANIGKYTNTLIMVSIMAILIWYTSFKAFRNQKILLYNITHTLWHTLSAILFLFI